MRASNWLFLLGRLIFFAFVFFTVSYCLVAYIPFTYQQVIVGELSPWFSRLGVLHRFLFWPVLGIALATIWTDLKAHPTCWPARAFASAGIVGGIALLFHPLLPQLRNDTASLVWCLLACIPLLWMAAIDFVHGNATPARIAGPSEEDARLFPATWRTAIYVSLVSACIAALRTHGAAADAKRWGWDVAWSFLSHALLFLLLFVLLDFVLAAAKMFAPQRHGLAIALPIAVLATITAAAVRYTIFPAISFRGWAAFAVAALLGASMVLFAAGSALRLITTRADPIHNGLELLATPFDFLRDSKLPAQAASLIGLGLAVWFASAHASRMDWEFLLQKTIMLVFWSAAFGLFYQLALTAKRSQRTLAYATATAVLVGYFAFSVFQPRRMEGADTATGQILEEYAANDISFRLADDLLRQTSTAADSSADNSFYSFVAENTNIPRNVHISPVDIHLVNELAPSGGRKPNVFIFVIDSLRRDYVSAYNPLVTFTPALGELARDSVVFENAFTRYGGTGLSEPSIWVGGLMVHQQYVTPFGPMNSLQKLMEVNGYEELISRDSILEQVVPESPNIKELDEHIGTMYYDLCGTLKELTAELPPRQASARPLFVYTQPQNIHISVINREGRSVPAGANFPAGFDPAYAVRVQAVDRCLGAFVQDLKRTGMYDDSIIVVTSDHGDSLGEHGRWGHAYTLFPEIVRIPLIVHLPSWLRDQVKYSTQTPAFLTDITPSLYYLLGEKPIASNELFGRPLFTDSPDEEQRYLQKTYLVVSSYAPVYGLVSGDGRTLYIADGVNYRDYLYELEPNGSSKEVPLTDEQKGEMKQQIEQDVNAIRQFYGMR